MKLSIRIRGALHRAARGFQRAIFWSWLAQSVYAQHAFTWDEIRAQFKQTNPTLAAAQAGIEESRADEVTAYLRPNPDFNLTADGFQVSRNQGVWQPLSGVFESPGFSYLHERRHKRELRLEVAKETTAVTQSSYFDQERNLIFTLRSAFIQMLQAKLVLENAQENLAYWDHELNVNQKRLAAGDLAQVDYDRLLLQRVQFESDFETARVNLRTAKIQLLQLLNSRTPIEQFDVKGPFESTEQLAALEKFREQALAMRPDLRAAIQSLALAKSNYQLAVADGSTDPTFSVWFTHNASIANPFANNTIGGSINIPLRIFDRNQGEKAHTLIDIGRNEKLRDAAQAQVYNDVDSAYVTLAGSINLLRPYESKYLELAATVRNRISFAYQHGGASLLDYLDAEKSYRDTRLAYLNLVGSYLTAAAQMNLAVGKEVM